MPKQAQADRCVEIGSKAILDAIGDAISIQDRDLRIVYQNPAHIRLMGEHLGEYCYAAYQQKSEACQGCHLLQCFADGEIHRRQSSAVKPDRGVIHVEIVSAPVSDASGAIVGGIESVRDVTDRVLMEERLQKQLAAIETSMDGIAILNSEGEYVYLNHAHAEVYGYPAAAELIGKSWRCLYEDDELERFQRDVLPILFERGAWRGEATGRRADGSRFPQELSLTITKDGGIICVVRDISDLRQSESQLRLLNLDLQARARELTAVNRELESFSYTVSHDLRKPLTVIKGYCELIQEGCGSQLKADCGEYLKEICQGADNMNLLIDALLRFSRISRSELHQQTVDLSAIATTVAAELGMTEPGRRVTFRIAESVTAEGDADLLRVVLDNLLGNAWKYTRGKEQAVIEFGMMGVEGGAAYYVRDNGWGFDMAHAGQLFAPFLRLPGAGAEGYGIGLATVERIVKRHGGKVWAEGEPGKGATVFFTL
ncbi:PAS domain S-box protein [Geomonas sp.]|uniref:PAS domain S-box protein n=1 Tax=Geomonas sp. TaxID=2651584 RepID=UPI002B47593A|nr:PAS domain S-box protein [Geomonas sp.]HJV36329.1 PAS domain S-box protein [Geomonas sp.]